MPDARDRSLKILALFQEKESRDELGIGAIRGCSIANQLLLEQRRSRPVSGIC